MAQEKDAQKGELPPQLQVLKKMSKDANFRVSFFRDPVRAVADAKITISIADLVPLTRITPAQFETLATVVKNSGHSVADNGEDLAYLVFCVVAFLLTIRPEGLIGQTGVQPGETIGE